MDDFQHNTRHLSFLTYRVTAVIEGFYMIKLIFRKISLAMSEM